MAAEILLQTPMNTPVTPTPTSPTSAPSSIPQMPPVSAKAPTATTPSKKKFPLKYILGGLLLLLVVIGGGVSYYLSQRSQDIRQQASTGYVCAADQVEVNGVCVNSSTGQITPGSGGDGCPFGQTRVDGTCMVGSGANSGYGCAANQVQVNGVCVDEPTNTGTGGTTNSDNTGGTGGTVCPADKVEVNGVCVDVTNSSGTGMIGGFGAVGDALVKAGGGITCIAACKNDSTCINNCSNQYSLGALASGTGLVANLSQQIADCTKSNPNCASQIKDQLSTNTTSSNDSYISSCSSKCSANDVACAMNCARNVVVNGSSNIVGTTVDRLVQLQGCNPEDLYKLNCVGKQTAQCVNGKAACADSQNHSGNVSSNGGIKCIEVTSASNSGGNTTQTVCKVIGTSCTGNLTASTYACSGGLKGAQCNSGTPSTSLTKPGDYIIPAIVNPGTGTFSSDGCSGVQIDLGRYGSSDTANGGFCGSLSFEMGKGCTFLTYSTPTPITLSQSPPPKTTGTGGGPNTPNNPPGTNPPASTPPGSYSCDSYCTSNAQCTGVNSGYTCTNNRCRLASNPNSSTCSPTEYTCNSTCTGDSQCQAINSSYVCSSGRCRLNSNPSSESCTPSTAGPVCLNLSISKQNPIKGDTVTFTCGQVTGATKYEFRVKLPSGEIRNIQAAASGSNVSRSFTVNGSGAHTAQCRICTGTDGSNCQAYESL